MGYHFDNEAVTPKKLNTIGPGPGASAQATPNLTVYVGPGVVSFSGVIVKYEGGNSPAITAPSVNPRIDLITIDSDGVIGVINGSEGATPSAPSYPTDKAVIAEVYMRVGSTSIKNGDDSTNGYIIRDSRALYHASDSMLESFNAYENISAGDAVAQFAVDNLVTVYAHDQTPTTTLYLLDEGKPRAQEFVVPAGVTKLKTISVYNSSASTPSLRLSVRDSLTGSDLASVTIAQGGPFQFNLDVSALTFTPGATYYVVFEDYGGAADGQWYGVADGAGRGWYYNGSSWSLSSVNHWLRVTYYEVQGAEGDIIKASGLSNDDWRFNFIGFATETVTAGNPCVVEKGRTFNGLSGFTDGAEYFLSDTNGAISTTAGTNSRSIGYADGTTSIVRHKKNKIVSPPLAMTASSGTIKAPGLWFTAQNNNPYTMSIKGVNVAPRYSGSLLVEAGDAFSTNAGTRYLQVIDVEY